MWYGRKSGSYIIGFELVQRIGVYVDREVEDKIANRLQTRIGNPKGYGQPYYARSRASVGRCASTRPRVHTRNYHLDGQMEYCSGV